MGHYRVLESHQLIPILSDINPALRLGLPNGRFPSGFPTYIPFAFLFNNFTTLTFCMSLVAASSSFDGQ
jgi:hypothetical protein